MSTHKREIYDAIIIGAGISGLVCGCYLARAGRKVLVVEQHDKPGGYCTSFKRRGFTFDAAAHSLGSYREGGSLRTIVTELGVDKALQITRFDPSDAVRTPDFTITFWNDTNETIRHLMDTFPSEKDNIVRFFAYFSGLRENAASVSPFDAVKLKGKSFDSFLRAFFTDDALMNAIACPVFGYVGLPPSLMQAATGIKIFHDYVLDGGYYPRGGMQELSNAFASVIERNNGTLLYRKRVTRILCNNNIAEGVELDNHDVYRSKNVVSACDITQTFKTFLGCDVVAEKVMHKLDDFVPSVSTFILYLGLSGPFDGLPNPGTNIWHLPAPDLEKVYEQIMHGDIGNSFGGHVFRVSPDRKTILVFCLTPYKTSQYWKLRKKDIARDLLAKIGALIPDLKNHVVYCDAASPETLFRFTRNHQGANYGWAPLPSQSFDPDFRQKTSVQGLYVTGHWTTQTHGIPSVAALGRHAANLILRRGWRNPA